MDWVKIKTMFIYLFLFLNIILASFYAYTVYLNKTELYQERDAIIISMKNDNINIIDPVIKKETMSTVAASIKYFSLPEKADGSYEYQLISSNGTRYLSINFEKSITNVNDNNYRDILDKFIMEKLDNEFSYVFDNYNVEEKVINYRQVIDNIPIYDNDNALLQFKVAANGDIISLTQTGLEDFKKDKQESVASANQAIHKLYHDNYIPKNSRVTSTIGYYTYVSQLTNQVLLPTWRIEVDNFGEKRVYYVDAINIKILDKKNETR